MRIKYADKENYPERLISADYKALLVWINGFNIYSLNTADHCTELGSQE